MEEEKAAAYYDELTRKGEGAARFKQGLGFSSSAAADVPKPGSALPSSSSFLSQFVKASSTSSPPNPPEPDKKAQLQSIQNKLNIKSSSESRVSSSSNSDRTRRRSRSRSRSRSRERYRNRGKDSRSRRRSRSRSRDRSHRHSDRDRSRSDSDGERDRDRRRRDRERGRRRSRSVSPRRQRRSEKNGREDRGKGREMAKENTAGVVDYAKLIRGYDNMSAAERVKAKMKLQLSETAAKDSEKGAGWERFEFNKDAPLDDEEIEVAEDDGSLVKHIGQSFRFSAVEAKREERIQAAHEEAMFGASALPPPINTDSEPEREDEEADKKELVTSLLSETVLAKQKGSWRDRVRQA
ncbi:uncharacterized protein LOC130714694 [Lotus japonicus]|uniref:uncharacterized protein LOC130714694 n=1 Tax=Lotus japonicus TaxID=34305 RepID=UPI0025885EF9|nr:uncharacterized protein LOC130714694 [Lotus japonicus]